MSPCGMVTLSSADFSPVDRGAFVLACWVIISRRQALLVKLLGGLETLSSLRLRC